MSDLINLRVRTRNTYIKIDPNAKVWDNTILDFFINEGYKKVQRDMGFDLPECQTSIPLITVGGTSEYDRPLDFQKLTGLYLDGTPLTKTTKNQTIINNSGTSKPCAYYQYGKKIGLYPAPDSIYSLNLLYNKYLPKITDSVPSELDEDFDEAVALYASYLALISVEKQAKATMCMAQYQIEIDSLFAQYINDDDDMGFPIDRNTSRPRQDGI